MIQCPNCTGTDLEFQCKQCSKAFALPESGVECKYCKRKIGPAETKHDRNQDGCCCADCMIRELDGQLADLRSQMKPEPVRNPDLPRLIIIGPIQLKAFADMTQKFCDAYPGAVALDGYHPLSKHHGATMCIVTKVDPILKPEGGE